MERSELQQFLDGFAERVYMIITEQLQIQGASLPIEAERIGARTSESFYGQKDGGRVLLCIVHDMVIVQEEEDIDKNEVTVRQDVQIPKSDGSLITLS